MSKYGWISEYTEHCLNMAVRARIERWKVDNFVAVNSLMAAGKPLQQWPEEQTRLQRAHKYQASEWLRRAIYSFADQDPGMLPAVRPHRYQRMLKKSKSTKLFIKEIQRRYAVVDRAYAATVVRNNGSLSRVSA